MIQSKPIESSIKVEEIQKAQEELTARVEEFFTAHKAREEELNTLITDIAVTMARHRGAPIPSEDKDERSNRLKALIHQRFKANVVESIFMG